MLRFLLNIKPLLPPRDVDLFILTRIIITEMTEIFFMALEKGKLWALFPAMLDIPFQQYWKHIFSKASRPL